MSNNFCRTGKVCHTTRASAVTHIKNITRKTGSKKGTAWEAPSIYKCPYCGYFHVGSKRRRGDNKLIRKPRKSSDRGW